MSIDDIRSLVNKRNEQIGVDYTYDEGYQTCKDFLNNNECSKVDDIVKMDLYECIVCLHYIMSEGRKTIKESREFIDSIYDYFRKLSLEKQGYLIDILFYLVGFEQVDVILDYLKEKSVFKKRNIIKRFDFSSEEFNETFEGLDCKQAFILLLDNVSAMQDDFNAIGFIEEVRDGEKTMELISSLLHTYKELFIVRSHFFEAIKEYGVPEKDRTKLLGKMYKDFYKTKELLEDIRRINDFVLKEDRNALKHKREANKEINGNETALQRLERESRQEEIIEARKLVDSIKDEDLKHSFLVFIYEHNMEYYKKLDEKLSLIRGDDMVLYLEELSKYGISINKDQVKDYMYNNISDFREMLSILSKLIDSKQIITVLKSTNLDNVRQMRDYVLKGFITTELLSQYLVLFDINNDYFSIFNNNIKLLNNNNINPALFINSIEVLLYNTDVLNNNIKVLDKYNLIKSIKTTDNLYFMNYSFEERIDKYIELGYMGYLEKDLGLLNYDPKRLELLSSMNIPIDNIEELKDVLTSDKFIVPDNNIDSYIPNALVYKEKVKLTDNISDLDCFLINPYSYKIGNRVISYNKVMRLIDEGYDTYDALFYNMNLSDSDYDSIINGLKPYTYKK